MTEQSNKRREASELREWVEGVIHLARMETDQQGGPRPTVAELADYILTGEPMRQARAMQALETKVFRLDLHGRDGYSIYDLRVGAYVGVCADPADLTDRILELLEPTDD